MGNAKNLSGWVIDTVRGTIQLPQHRVTRLTTMLQEVEGQRRVSQKQWRKLLGELRSMMLAIPGAEGMFSHIQAALVKAVPSNRIKVDRSARDELRNWKCLPATVLCCDGNRGGSCQHCIEGENSAAAHAASTRPGIIINRTCS